MSRHMAVGASSRLAWGALALVLASATAGAARPERPPDVPADRPYLEYYESGMLVRGWVIKVGLEEETFDFFDSVGRAEVRGIPFTKLPPTDRDRLRKWRKEGRGEGGEGGVGDEGDEGEGADLPELGGGEQIPAVKFFFKNGPPIVGLELEEMSTENTIFIRTKKVPLFSIPRDVVLRTETVTVHETDILPVEYLYRVKLEVIAPEAGRDHYELAEYCRSIGDYDHAREHYLRAKFLDPRIEMQAGRRIEELDAITKALTVTKLNQEISSFVRRADYQQALESIRRLGVIDPRSRSYINWMEKVEEIEEKLAQNLRCEIVNSYYRKMDELIRRYAFGRVTDGPDIPGELVMTRGGRTFKGRVIDQNDEVISLEVEGREIRIDRNMVKFAKAVNLNQKKREATFAEAKEYVTSTEGGLSADIASALVEQYGDLIIAHMESEKQKAAEEDEGEEGAGPAEAGPAPDDIFGDLPEETPEAAEDAIVPAEVVPHQEVRDQIKKFWDGRLTNIFEITDAGTRHVAPVATPHSASYGPGSWLREGATSVASGDAGEAPDKEKWWRILASARDVRYQILRAMAAEAHCKVDRVTKKDCPNCGGTGLILLHGMMGQSTRRLCGTCKGVRSIYTVKFR